MKQRVLFAMFSVTLVLAVLSPLAPVAAEQQGTGVQYDLAKVRAAMARGAKRVGPLPAKPSNDLDGRPIGWRHSLEPVTLTQPDGSTFKARGLELEEGGGQATLDGHLVTQKDNGWWHFGVRRDNGRIRAVDAVAGRDRAPAATLATRMPAAFRTSLAEFTENAEQLRQFTSSRAMAEAAAAAEAGEPVVFKIPALMYEVNNDTVESGDTTADDFQPENTAENLHQRLSGIGTTGTGTVTEMYLEQSFGKMVIEIDVYGPYEGPASQVPCMFGTDGAPITGDVLGLGGGGAKGMAAEAVPLSDADVNYDEYDNDRDGWADFVTILHSGPDAAATGNPCNVWSHYIGPIAGEPAAVSTDVGADNAPVRIGAVLTIPEVDLQIGVTAHEIMHALGEPDYYGTAGTVGTGDWDLGAGGSWAGIPAQTNPVHFNPVMKINFGWIEPTLITKTSLNEALRPRANYPDMLQVPLKIAEAGSDDAALCDQAPVGVEHQNVAFLNEDGDCLVEGFLVENLNPAAAGWSTNSLDCRFRPADFDRQLYGSGLMVWHWDFTNYESLGNDNVLRPMLDIEEFDRRDGRQELGTGVTRGQPLDVFWGDPVGISGATQVPPGGEDAPPPPDGSPWTVTGPPTFEVGDPPADPQPEWTAADAPEGTGMVIDLTWEQTFNDWDLYIDKWVNGAWVEITDSASPPPGDSEKVAILDYQEGDKYRARAYNYASTEQSAELSVTYSADTAVLFGPAGTRNNDAEQTGWQITNIRPNDYNGVAHEAALPRTPIRLDVIKHTKQTVDVSGDFLYRAGGTASPFEAGTPVTLTTNVYNHGGKAVDNATFTLFDGDPDDGGERVATKTVDLGGYSRDEVEFDFTPKRGLNELYVVADAAGDQVAGNNVVRTELEAFGGEGDVLIVDNDFGWTFEEDYEAVFNSLGVSYDIVEGDPTPAVLGRYDAVVWITTAVSGDQGVISDDATTSIGTYLDNGGRVWLASTRAAGYLTTRDATNDTQWLAGYFGIEIEQNLLNSPGTVTGLGESIGGERDIEIGYMDGKPYIDYGQVATEGVKGEAKGLFSHELIPIAEEDPVDVVATSVDGSAEAGGFRTVYGLPINLVQDPAERTKLTQEILDFFGVDGDGSAPNDLTVRFNRFQMVQDGEPWRVTVGAAGAKVDKVELMHRPYGTSDWRSLELTEAGDGLYSGVIPGKQIPNNGLEYFARVTNGGKVVDVDGGADMPNVATAPYGDPVQDAACDDGGTGPTGGDRDKDPDGGSGLGPSGDGRDRQPTLPATGMQQGLALGGLLLLAGLWGWSRLHRRTD